MSRNALGKIVVMLAAFGVAWVAMGDDAKNVDRSSLSPEQKQAMRLEAEKSRPRFENVRYTTATPLATRGGNPVAPPSSTVIEYDNNVAVSRNGLTSNATTFILIGNQFNVGGGGAPIVGPWTITGFVVQNAGPAFPSATPAATAVFAGGPGTGTTAPVLGVVGGLPLTGGIQAFPLATPIVGSGSFLAGVINSTWQGCTVTSVPPGTVCDGVALDTAANSTNPLGFHAMKLSLPTSGAGFGFAPLGNLNAIFKVTGSSLPVELTRFSVGTE